MRSTYGGHMPSRLVGRAQFLNFTSPEQQHGPTDTPIMAAYGLDEPYQNINTVGKRRTLTVLKHAFYAES